MLVGLFQSHGVNELQDVAFGFAVFASYSFGYTLVLGLFGWAVARALRRTSALAYCIVGGACGCVALFLGSTKPTWDNPYTYLFTAAGVAAAVVFRFVYYRNTPTGYRGETAA